MECALNSPSAILCDARPVCFWFAPLLCAFTGKPSSVRVYPLGLLERAPAWGIELEPTRTCHLQAVGTVGKRSLLAVAIRKRIVLLDVDARCLFAKLAVRTRMQG